MKNYPGKIPNNAMKAAFQAIDGKPSEFDPLGMYTGIPSDKNDKPIQDSDDL